ncbi:MAG: cation-translocating P-type ATPase [Acidobacteriota bacterium]|nr:cation-translocating P-type ATPase [Acidobacteriota bacterium]
MDPSPLSQPDSTSAAPPDPPGTVADPASPDWHVQEAAAVCRTLEVDPARGLDADDVQAGLAQHGPNELAGREGRRLIALLWDQVGNALILLLVIAAGVSAALGDVEDAIAIAAILVLNAALGFSQEYRAEQALSLLKRLAVPRVVVRRAHRVVEASARELVPGDIVLLAAGDRVPADGRLLSSANLRIEESALTGESQPVDKDPARMLDADATIGDRRNMAYMGTTVVYGRGEMVVTGTGMRTELGRVAGLMGAVGRQATPLQRRLDRLGWRLAVLALALVGVLFVIGLARGESLTLVFVTAVSLAVAAVPEGLPAVVTIGLALGARRMLKRRVLIRKLTAVETLGGVTVICSDKTGTLTENRMTAVVAEPPDGRRDLTAGARPAVDGAVALLLVGGALCSDAHLPEEGDSHAIGDPTETALVEAASRFGLDKRALTRALPRADEVPFDSDRKRMTTLHRVEDDAARVTGPAANVVAGVPWVSFTKGAVEALLDRCTSVRADDRTEPMTGGWRHRIQNAHDGLAADGVRVLAVAYRTFVEEPPVRTLEHDLTFAGMVGLMDPPRPAVRDAVETCRRAGIRPVMITGDHPLTAEAVARAIGLPADGGVVTGSELAEASEEDLAGLVERVGIYARVQPEQKLNIVQALQARGHVVAMTGDGVNDAPALKRADIGVAMGITGTDVAKDAADMVLQDDDFSSIVAAVEEGRVIFDNIRKFVRFILASNFGEILVMIAGPLAGMPLPLLPIQILWINLLTDGPPALALSVEPAEPDTMRRPPYPTGEGIFDRATWAHIVFIGLLIGGLSILPGYSRWAADDPTWQTIVFTALTFGQLAQALAIRSSRESLLAIGLRSNPMLLAAVAGMAGMQLMVIYVPVFQTFLGTVPLSAAGLGLCVGIGLAVLLAVELEKAVRRWRLS